MDYVAYISVFVGLYAVLAVSLDLLVGHSGILSVAHGAFYGIGAYGAALVSRLVPGSGAMGILGGATAAASAAMVLGILLRRLSGERLVLATFAVQLIATAVMLNWIGVTGGPLGLSVENNGQASGGGGSLYGLLQVLVVLVLACAMVRTLGSGAYGRALHAMREDEILAQSRGRNTQRYRWEVFCVSAGLAGAAGGVYAHLVGFVDPTGFTFAESALVLSMVIVGGPASLKGALLGAALLVLLPEGLRFVGLPSAVAANVRQIIVGLAMILILVLRPRGLVGRFGFGR